MPTTIYGKALLGVFFFAQHFERQYSTLERINRLIEI